MNTLCKKIEHHTTDAYIVDENMSVLLKCTKCNWSHFQSVDQWAEQILPLRDELVKEDPDTLQEQFIQIVSKKPMYGSHWFYVYKEQLQGTNTTLAVKSIQDLPRSLLIGINSEGMDFYDRSTRKHLLHWPLNDVIR